MKLEYILECPSLELQSAVTLFSLLLLNARLTNVMLGSYLYDVRRFQIVIRLKPLHAVSKLAVVGQKFSNGFSDFKAC